VSTIIPPNPGRMVHFYPGNFFRGHKPPQGLPLGATIAAVHHDRCVNLCIFDHLGLPVAMQSVVLVQEGDTTPAEGNDYATWMPYQLGQAKKEEAKAPAPAGEAGLTDRFHWGNSDSEGS
jgi:hypothetical protein